MLKKLSEIQKTVYGPVHSWRFGLSLGIDPLFEISTCSFNCIYCQLGQIQNITADRRLYVSTAKVVQDFTEFAQQDFQVITFSGSGEPTLASNLGEIAQELKKYKPGTPLLCLTNSTLLNIPEVQKDLQKMDRVIAKLDAPDHKTLSQMNRVESSINFAQIYQGLLNFRQNYTGKLDIQIMFMQANLDKAYQIAQLLKEIQPDTVQLNTPKRPYPLSWNRDSRGNHSSSQDYEVRKLKVISPSEAAQIEQVLREETGLKVLSVYRE